VGITLVGGQVLGTTSVIRSGKVRRDSKRSVEDVVVKGGGLYGEQ
jgi:hypothetical protein